MRICHKCGAQHGDDWRWPDNGKWPDREAGMIVRVKTARGIVECAIVYSDDEYITVREPGRNQFQSYHRNAIVTRH